MINDEKIVMLIIKQANINNMIVEEIIHSQSTAMKIQFLKAIIKNSNNKVFQNNYLIELKDNFSQDKVLIQLVIDYINHVPGSFKNMNKIVNDLNKVLDKSTIELKRLYNVYPRYYNYKPNLMKKLELYLKAL